MQLKILKNSHSKNWKYTFEDQIHIWWVGPTKEYIKYCKLMKEKSWYFVNDFGIFCQHECFRTILILNNILFAIFKQVCIKTTFNNIQLVHLFSPRLQIFIFWCLVEREGRGRVRRDVNIAIYYVFNLWFQIKYYNFYNIHSLYTVFVFEW